MVAGFIGSRLNNTDTLIKLRVSFFLQYKIKKGCDAVPLYRPTDIYPNFDTIDVTKDCEFTWRFKGNDCLGHEFDIYDSDGESVLSSPYEETYSVPAQNNDIITHIVPANTMTSNGDAFSWKLTLRKNEYDTLIRKCFGNYATGDNTLIELPMWRYEDHPPAAINPNTLIKVGMRVRVMRRDSSIWKELGKITNISIAHYPTGINRIITTHYVRTQINPPTNLGNNYRVEIYDNSITISPNYVINTASESQILIDSIDTGSEIKSPAQTFTASYTQAEGVPFLRYYWELYRNGVKIDETEYLTSSNIEYTYKGFVDYGKTYTLKIVLEDKLGRIVTDEKTYTVNFDLEIVTPVLLAVKKGYNVESCIESGCLEVSWDHNPTALDKVIISREEDDSGIFEIVAELDWTDKKLLKDYNIKTGTSYRYKITHYSSVNTETLSYVYQSLSEILNYESRFWFVIGLNDLKKKNAFIVNPNNVWAFELNVNNSTQTQHEHTTIYNTLGQYPRMSKGFGNYISSSLNCLIGNVIQAGCYNESKNIIEQWRLFCNKNIIKLVRDRNGGKFLCSLTDNEIQTDESNLRPINSISFTYTEVMRNNFSIIGE